MNLSLLRQKRQTIILIMLFFAVITTVVTIFQDFKYEARSKILLIEKYPAGTDPYSISKSSERLTNILAEVVKSKVFYQESLNAGFNIELDYFQKGNDPRDELKAWQKTVYPKAVNDLGAVEISVLHTNKYQAEQIAKAVIFTLASKHAEYHGGGENVAIKEIDSPVASNQIVYPNIPLNYALTFVIGFLAALMYVYLFPEPEYDLRIFKARRRAGFSLPLDMSNRNLSGQARFDSRPATVNRTNYSPFDDLDAPMSAVELARRQAPAAPIRDNQSASVHQRQDNRPSFQGSMDNVLG